MRDRAILQLRQREGRKVPDFRDGVRFGVPQKVGKLGNDQQNQQQNGGKKVGQNPPGMIGVRDAVRERHAAPEPLDHLSALM